MKTNLPCAVVRDLLPSYLEGLTEEETTAAVQEHLQHCSDCRCHLEAMSAGKETAETEKEQLDYLKKVRKNGWIKTGVAVFLAVLLVLGGVGVKLFLIGSPADADFTFWETSFSEEGKLRIAFTTGDSASDLVGLKLKVTGDKAEVNARKVLVSPFSKFGGEDFIEVDTAGLSQIEVFGRIIWKDGRKIDVRTGRLFQDKIPNVGNASAVNQLISDLDLDSPHILELHTGKEPYGLTIHFTEPIADDRRFMVEGNAAILIALIENLDTVFWDDPKGWSGSLTVAQADAALPGLTESYNRRHQTTLVSPAGIKACGKDIVLLRILQDIFQI